MRKSFFYMVVFTLLLVLGISSCGKPELKKDKRHREKCSH